MVIGKRAVGYDRNRRDLIANRAAVFIRSFVPRECAGCFIDMNNNGIPDRFEEEKVDEKNQPR